MTRRLLLIGVCTLLWMGTLMGPVTASMQAVIVNGGACALFDGDGNLVVVPDGFFLVVTPSGNRVNQCRAFGLDNPTGQAVHFDFASTGVLCSAGGVLTEDWRETVSASGNAVITCMVK
jgi:hypothetical protein